MVGRGRLTVNLEEEISCSDPSVRKCRFFAYPSASLLAPCLLLSTSTTFLSLPYSTVLPPFLSSFRGLSHTHLTPLDNHSHPSLRVFTLTRSSSDNASTLSFSCSAGGRMALTFVLSFLLGSFSLTIASRNTTTGNGDVFALFIFLHMDLCNFSTSCISCFQL